MLRYNGSSSDLPKSGSDAKKHIAKIRKARDKDKKSGIAGMMDNAIGMWVRPDVALHTLITNTR